MSVTCTNVTLRDTSHARGVHDSRVSASFTSRPCSHLSTVYTLGHSSPVFFSVQEWLHQMMPGAPPPTPTVVTFQAVFEVLLGATASALAPQRSQSSRHSHSHATRCSRHSSRPSMTAKLLEFTSRVTGNHLQVA